MSDPDASVSLKKLGLKADNLTCPKGGPHHIEYSELVVIAKRGQGAASCAKCGGLVQLSRLG